MNPPSIDVDGLGSNLLYDLYQTQTAQEGYSNGHSESFSVSGNPKPFTVFPFSSLSAPPQAPTASLALMVLYPLCGAILTLANGADLRLDGLVFVQQPLIGRGTYLAHATATPNWDTTEDSDTLEGGNITEGIGFMEGTVEDTDKTEVYEKPNRTFVVKHYCDILRSSCKALDDAQFRLSERLKCDGNHFEDRVLQPILMTELLPVTELRTSDELIPAIRGIFKSYRILYEHTNIVHGDISLDSLKCRKVEGKIYGVLIDYDLSLFFNKPKAGPSSKQRTGTRPYMAIDLLQPTPTKHFYRHDLESLFYVIVVLVTRYDGGKEINNPPLQLWFHSTPRSLRLEKESFLRIPPPQPTSAFQSFRSLLFRMGDMFHNGYEARDKHIKSVTLKWMLEKRPRTLQLYHVDYTTCSWNIAVPYVFVSSTIFGGTVLRRKFKAWIHQWTNILRFTQVQEVYQQLLIPQQSGWPALSAEQ